MQQPTPLRHFESSKTTEMEDFISAGTDIQRVTLLTKKASEINDNSSDDSLRLYFESALITYARPFASGVRNRLKPEEVFGTRDDALKHHGYLIEQRNKLVAHNVNPFEETVVGVLLDSENNLVGIGNLTGRLTTFNRNDYAQFNRLANEVLNFINERLQKLEQEVLSQAQKLSSDKLSKLKIAQITVPGPESVSISKRKV